MLTRSRFPLAVSTVLVGLILSAGLATAAATSGDEGGRQPAPGGEEMDRSRDMGEMHDRMMREHPNMAEMHDRMMREHPDMARMHEVMMGEGGMDGAMMGGGSDE